MTCGTIEEKIYRKQVFKGGLFKTATEHKEQTRYFSQQELHELFSIPESGFDVSLTQQQLHEEHDSQHKIDDSLKQHIKFLEGQGIAGVSHHNLLYSKTAPVQPPVPEDEDALKWDRRKKEYAPSVSRYPPSKHSSDDVRNGPKDHKPIMCKSEIRLDDTARQNLIKEEIKRLSITYANKDMISRLSDKGEKICNRMKDLTNQLNNMQRVGVKHMPGNECSPDSVVSQDSFFVDTHEFEGDKLHKVESIKENLQRGVCEKAHLSQRSNIVNIDDMSEVLGKLSVQDSVE